MEIVKIQETRLIHSKQEKFIKLVAPTIVFFEKANDIYKVLVKITKKITSTSIVNKK